MDQLVIRDGELRGAITAVRASRNEFAQAVSRTDALQQEVGHAGLSGALQGFESRWSVRREKLVTSLEVIEKQLQGVLDTFGEWDRANTLSRQAPGGPGTPTGSASSDAPPAPVAPPAPTPGASPSVAPPAPSAPESVTPSDAPTPASEGPWPSDVETPSLEPGADTTPDGQGEPVLPGSPEAINDLLDRLERLADTPAGLAALAGSVGALAVLLALVAPGSTGAPGLAGVDSVRVRKLLERYTAATNDAFDGLTSTPAPPVVADIDQQLDELDAVGATEGETAIGEGADGDAVGAEEDPADGGGTLDSAESAAATTDLGDSAADDDLEPLASGTAAPLADLPPPPVAPDAVEDPSTATSSAFDERFPASPSGGWDDASLKAGPGAVDVNAELIALAGTDTDPGRDGGAALTPRMPMVAGGMGAMASASAGHAVMSTQGKSVDTGGDDRLAAVRRELDELRAMTEKEEKP